MKHFVLTDPIAQDLPCLLAEFSVSFAIFHNVKETNQAPDQTMDYLNNKLNYTKYITGTGIGKGIH
jgi:hypothetical protein